MSPEKNVSSPSPLPPPASSSSSSTTTTSLSSPSSRDVVVSGCTTASSSSTSTIASSVVTPLLHSKNTTGEGETDLSLQQADNNNNNSSNNRADNNTTTSNGTSSGASPSHVDDSTSTSPHLHNSNRTGGSRSTSSPNPNSQPSTNRTIVSSSSHILQTATPSSVPASTILSLVSQQQPSSVIQSNHQSVIQSGVQLGQSKNVLLVNSKHNHAGSSTSSPSVIQSTTHPTVGDLSDGVQLISRNELASKVGSFSSPEDESKKRREVLERRPSYRKILNDLSSAEVSAIAAQFNQNLQQQHLLQEIKSEPDQHPSSSSHHPSHHPSVVNLNGPSSVSSTSSSSPLGVISPPSAILSAAAAAVSSPYLKVVPASTIQLAPGSQELGSLSALTVNTGSASGGSGGGGGGHPTSSIVQYAHGGQDGQSFFVPVSAYPNGGHFHSPVTVSPDLSAYQLGGRGSSGLSPGVMSLSPTTGPPHVEEASKKRELRLLKNREAAKECRRKKKEYIKCLENRVAVLENQNKALIEELKSLKELYCSKE